MAQSPPAFRPAKKNFGYSTGLGLRTTDPWRGLGRSRQSSGLCCIQSQVQCAECSAWIPSGHPKAYKDLPCPIRSFRSAPVSRRHHRRRCSPGPVPRHRHRHRRPLRPGTGNHPRAGPGRRARHRRGARRRGRPRADSRHRQGPGRTAGSRQAGQRARFRPALPGGGQHVDMLICGAGIMACLETRVGPGWEAVRHQPPGPLRAGQPALAGAPQRRAWSPSRPPDTINPTCAGTMCSSRGLRQMAGLRAVENRERPVCPASGQAGTSAWRARLFAASWQDLHAAATHLTRAEMTAAGWLDASGQPTQLQDRAARRGHPDLGSRLAAAGRHGRAVLRGLRRRRAGPGRTALFRRRARTRSIPTQPRGFGRSAGLTGIDAFAAR